MTCMDAGRRAARRRAPLRRPHATAWSTYTCPPGAAAPRPLVFYVHGGFWRQEWDRTHARPLADALAAEGYVVAMPEYRRVGGSGGWPATVEDVEAALRALPGTARRRSASRPPRPRSSATPPAGTSCSGWPPAAPRIDRDRRARARSATCASRRARDGLGRHGRFLGGTPDELPEVYDAADPATRLRGRPVRRRQSSCTATATTRCRSREQPRAEEHGSTGSTTASSPASTTSTSSTR